MKTSYHHPALRKALIAAALQLVAERGPAGFSLREVTRRVGVTHAAPYRHFPHRAALLAAVAEDGFIALGKAMARARDRIPGRRRLARVEALGHAYIRFATRQPSHFRVMFSSESTSAHGASLEAARNGAFAHLVVEIRLAQQAGLVRGGSPESLALPAWAIVHGLSALLVDRVGRLGASKAQMEQQARLVTRTLLEGMVARGGRRVAG